MKIVIATNLYPPIARGGSERVARLSAEAFLKSGHKVVIFTAQPFYGAGSLLPNQSEEKGIIVYRWFPLNLYFYGNAAKKPAFLRLVWTFFDLFNLHSYFVVRRLIKRENPDLIISHNLKGLGLMVARAFASSKKPYIHVLHDVQLMHPSGLLYPSSYKEILNDFGARIYMILTRWLFAAVPIVVSPSSFLLSLYHSYRFFNDTTQKMVVLNPVARNKKERLTHDGVNVVFFEMEEHKGVRLLLSAWQEMRLSDIKLWLVGGGSLMSEVNKLVSGDKSVAVKGRLTQEENEHLWQIADIVVAPSLCLENAPTVISEALVRGIWVVASDVGGVKELASLGRGVELVEAGNSTELSKALLKTIEKAKSGQYPPLVSLPSAEEYNRKISELANISF